MGKEDVESLISSEWTDRDRLIVAQLIAEEMKKREGRASPTMIEAWDERLLLVTTRGGKFLGGNRKNIIFG